MEAGRVGWRAGNIGAPYRPRWGKMPRPNQVRTLLPLRERAL